MADLASVVRGFMAKHAPSRHDMQNSVLLKPFGHRIRHSELWRFTRRSVPRGVAVGLFVGIFLMVPGLQIVGAALVCMALRGNVAIAAAMTFLSNPGDDAILPRCGRQCRQPAGISCRSCHAPGAGDYACEHWPLVRLAGFRCGSRDGYRAGRDRGGFCVRRILGFACRMALVDWPQMGPTPLRCARGSASSRD